jgi:hypothetical protein
MGSVVHPSLLDKNLQFLALINEILAESGVTIPLSLTGPPYSTSSIIILQG